MAKWCDTIGFVIESEDEYGVVKTVPVERRYIGDFEKNYRRLHDGISVDEQIVINNVISIIADPFMTNNFHTIRYAEYMGVRWKVESVDVQFPRIRLTLGGEYTNG